MEESSGGIQEHDGNPRPERKEWLERLANGDFGAALPEAERDYAVTIMPVGEEWLIPSSEIPELIRKEDAIIMTLVRS